jgi:hypothetical protein
VHGVIQDEGIRQVSEVTPVATGSGQTSMVTSAAEVGGDPTVVVEVELMTYQLVECRLSGTSVSTHKTISRRS